MSLPLIPLDQIHPHPDNARADLGDLSELAASIRAVGLLQPLVVTQVRNGWRIVDGHRRHAAARLAGRPAVPCIAIKPGDTGRDLGLMLAAAMHKQLEPLERGRAFAALRDSGLSVTEIARRTGYSTSTIASSILIAGLPEEVTDRVQAKEITLAEATRVARDLRTNGGGTAAVHSPALPSWLGKTHRLAAVVSGACTHKGARRMVGGVGCGQCWEHAIRFDEHLKAATS